MNRGDWVGRAGRAGVRFVCAIALCAACSGDDEPADNGDDVEGLAMCCELGAICHPQAGDPLGDAKRACHDLGHENDPAACRREYESCVAVCGEGAGEEPHACR